MIRHAEGPGAKPPLDDMVRRPERAAPVLRLEGVAKVHDGRPVLDDLSVDVRDRETVAVLGHRGSGRTTLAGIVTGRLQPSAGRVLRDGPVAPPVGQPAGIGATGRLERDLGLRALTWGIERWRLVETVLDAVAALPETSRHALPADAFLAWRAERLPPAVRQTVLHAAAWGVPASLYVVDGALLPGDHTAAEAVAPMMEAARERAAILWLPPGASALRRITPDRLVRLENGRLVSEGRDDSVLGVNQTHSEASASDAGTVGRRRRVSMVEIARARFASKDSIPPLGQEAPRAPRETEGLHKRLGAVASRHGLGATEAIGGPSAQHIDGSAASPSVPATGQCLFSLMRQGGAATEMDPAGKGSG